MNTILIPNEANFELVKREIKQKINPMNTQKENEENEKFYKRLLKSEYYEYVDTEDNNLIFGYIAVQKTNKGYHFIECINTALRGYNICERIIEMYQNKFNTTLIPYEIQKDSSLYWLRYFYKNSNRLNTFEILAYSINKKFNIDVDNDLRWNDLKTEYNLFNKFIKRKDVNHDSNIVRQYRNFKKNRTFEIQMKMLLS